MHVAYHAWHSPRLGQQFELKVYGTAGYPMLVFPSSEGRFFDFEDFGMPEACRWWIDNQKLQIFAVDGRDKETWANNSIHPHQRAVRHNIYESVITDEVIPFIRSHNPRAHTRDIIVTGCSFGAYQAANFFLKHPDVCNVAICLSGIYSVKYFLGDYVDEAVYLNDPIRFVPNLSDDWYLTLYRNSRIILACGQGAWEEECLAETRQLSDALNGRGVNHWLDIWGTDVNHDWPWWRKQIAYHLGKLDL